MRITEIAIGDKNNPVEGSDFLISIFKNCAETTNNWVKTLFYE